MTATKQRILEDHVILPSEDECIAQWGQMSRSALAELDPDGGFEKRHLLNPAVLRMLGDVAGKRVLDAGSGQGYFSRMLAERGARVVSLEPAESLFQFSVEREAELSQGIDLIQADLTTVDLPAEFDAVVANMVFLAIPRWKRALRATISALRPGGQLIFSIDHPCFEGIGQNWRSDHSIEVTDYLTEYAMPRRHATDFHRPLQTYLNAVTNNGGTITEIAEPRLDPSLVGAPDAPDGAEALTHIPNFLIVSARRHQ
ncbi:MAG: class I SAM-dependent methyltransferase [Nocardioidaceae bacterium]